MSVIGWIISLVVYFALCMTAGVYLGKISDRYKP